MSDLKKAIKEVKEAISEGLANISFDAEEAKAEDLGHEQMLQLMTKINARCDHIKGLTSALRHIEKVAQ
jgi:hypothetical protein